MNKTQNITDSKNEIEGNIRDIKPNIGISNRSKKIRKRFDLKTKWDECEKKAFEKGYKLHKNRWMKLHEIIPSKTPMQIKRYAERLLKYDEVPPSLKNLLKYDDHESLSSMVKN